MRVKLLALLVLVAMAGCTVTPSIVKPGSASYDGNEQNSGIVSQGPSGYVVTAHFRDRYNALVKTYGRDFKPVVEKDAGLVDLHDGTFLFDKQHMVQFLEMNAWLRAGLQPVNP